MSEELQQRIENFHDEYLNVPEGQKHLARSESEPAEVQKVFSEIKEKHLAGKNIKDDVLKRLLPHSDTEFHRNNNYRISTWPCITKDICLWFEGAGWKKPEDWAPTAQVIFEGVDGLVNGETQAWDKFLKSDYRKGFGTGFISPILYCLDNKYPVINSKVVKTYKYCKAQLGEPHEIDAKIENYLENAEKLKALVDILKPIGMKDTQVFDIFCHYMVSKRIGGADFTTTTEPKYDAWLFVANPEIYKWDQAFEEGGVEWTGSLGAHAQKLLRRKIKSGDRVFGYQAGPHYEIYCEMKVAKDPYKTSKGSWGTRLEPVSKLETPITLSMMKSDPVLSTVKFLKQSQASISGITGEQLAELDKIIDKPEEVLPEISSIDKLCKDLCEAQFDTSNPSGYESLLAEAFGLLGFEVEHLGGPGKPDVLITGRLGSNSYTVVVEAKTCKKDNVVSLAQVNYSSMNDHKEEHTGDYAVMMAAKFAGGKLVEHAVKNRVGMITTDTLISVLRQHDQFAFSIDELKCLFEIEGFDESVKDKIFRINAKHQYYLQLTVSILNIFDELQRQQDVSESISNNALYLLLLDRAQKEETVTPERSQIDQVLLLLSNPVLDILSKEEDGYILKTSLETAKQRVSALESFMLTEE